MNGMMDQKIRKIGFLGCGKIGSALLAEVETTRLAQALFVQDPFMEAAQKNGIPVIRQADAAQYRQADLIIECATADALRQNIDAILANCDLFLFSVTAFSDEEFERNVRNLCSRHHTHVYIPHGAILGLDGIADGRGAWETVSIQTVKNPQSLGRHDTERTVLYQGSTRGACQLFPRNVNVHAAVALAGIGFDRTQSQVIADPAATTNTHIISLHGAGIDMQIQVSSFTRGGVTGKYTPLSACGSLRRILDKDRALQIV